MKRIVTVVGARPQFIKAGVVSRAMSAIGLSEVLVHTGQHYDAAMSDIFFRTLALPAPAYHLAVGSAGHGAQTARILESLEPILEMEKPDAVLVYGDTNSTLAGALCAAKRGIPVIHVEAGLRSFNRRMPEEINRIVTDHLSSQLFVPTDAAVLNLMAEGIRDGVIRTGDVMYDTALLFRGIASGQARETCARFNVTPGGFALATVHRAENTDDPERWREICQGLSEVARRGLPTIWVVHPRVAERCREVSGEGLQLSDPLPYFEMQTLLMNARVVLTDSGGLQKEAAFYRVPCVTLRDETEWVELLTKGLNHLAGATSERIVELAFSARWPEGADLQGLFGDGHAAETIAHAIRHQTGRR